MDTRNDKLLSGDNHLTGGRLAHEGDFALHFNGRAAPSAMAMEAAIGELARGARRRKQTGFVWIHCHFESDVLRRLHESEAIDAVPFELLGAAETRPRCVMHGAGAIVNLRGRAVNSVDGENDLVALRAWLSPAGVITTWRRPTLAVEELVGALHRGYRPPSVGDFIARLASWVIDTIEPMVDQLSEKVDALEIAAVGGDDGLRRRELSEARRDAIDLRRFLYPLRDALSTLFIEHLAFLHAGDRAKLHDAHDRLMRYIEELEVTRERCMVLHDEIIDNRSIEMNRQIFMLSIVSVVFLPLGLIAGMLGMNVGGIPASEGSHGFWTIAATLAGILVLELALLRRLKLL